MISHRNVIANTLQITAWHVAHTSNGVLGCWLWTVLDRNVDRKTFTWALAILAFEIGRHREGALGSFVIALDSEERAIRYETTRAGAGVDGVRTVR